MKYKTGGRCRGEMTVFLSLTIMLVASLLFTLIEVSRFRCLYALADMDSALEAHSSFAEFDAALLEEYGLLFLDGSYGSGELDLIKVAGRIMDLAEENLDPESVVGKTFLRMKLRECEVDHYELATDYEGDAFRRQAVEFAKENLLTTAVEALQDRLDHGSDGEDTEEIDPGEVVGDVEGTMQEAAEAAAGEEGEDSGGTEDASQLEFENPFDLFHLLQGKAVLTLVLPEGATVSTKAVDNAGTVSSRVERTGNYPEHEGTSPGDQIWFLAYLDHGFGCYQETRPDRSLDYELEYILCGKKTDKKNLEEAVGRIMLLREAANLAYIETDTAKMETAQAIAAAITGLLLVPELAGVVSQAILVIWAYVESLQDMRTLLRGGRVPLVKSAETWVTDVLNPATSFDETNGSVEDQRGLSYRDYLLSGLALRDRKALNLGTMGMIELNLRQREGKENFRMDNMIQKMDLGFRYEAAPLFLSFVLIGDVDRGNYSFDREQKISYLSR